MKFYLVLFILICGGGWYYYDTHYAKSSFFKKDSQPAAAENALTAKQLELEQKAKELFPTKVSERTAWVERQLAAYVQVSKVRDGVSPEIAANIRKFAEKKYPLDYDKQLDVVARQELAAISILQILSSAKLNAAESAEILEAASKNMAGDYVSQSYAIQKIIDAYNSIKSKASMMSERDYNILRRKAMSEIAVSPENAVKEFERQYLARHNFLTKTISPSWGDLRSGIEEFYPEDFVAQLAELDKRIREKLSGSGSAPVMLAATTSDGTSNNNELLNSNVSLYPCVFNDEGYFCAFVEINGKSFLMAPAQLIQKINEDSFNYARIGMSGMGDIFMSTNSSLAIVNVPKDSVFESIKTLDNKSSYSSGTFEVKLLGFDGKCSKVAYDATLVDGELRYSEYVEKELGFDIVGNMLVVDAKTGILIGFCSEVPGNGLQRYNIGDFKGADYFKNKVLGINNRTMGDSNIEFKKIYMAPINYDSKRHYAMVYFGDIEGWQKFSVSKNKDQLIFLDRLCRLNYGVCDFMLENTYANALESPVFGKVAEKHRNSFFRKVNTAKGAFMGDYRSYLSDINATGVGSSMFAKKEFFESFYYSNRIPALSQLEIWNKTLSFLNSVVKNATDEKMLHSDLADNFENGYYKAKLQVKKTVPGGEDSRVDDTMGKIKFRLKSK